MGSSRSMKSSSAWLKVAQSSTFIVPSGRSAITCNVFVSPPIRRSRTRRNPAASMAGVRIGSRCDNAVIMGAIPLFPGRGTKAFGRGGSCEPPHNSTLLYGDGGYVRRWAAIFKGSQRQSSLTVLAPISSPMGRLPVRRDADSDLGGLFLRMLLLRRKRVAERGWTEHQVDAAETKDE